MKQITKPKFTFMTLAAIAFLSGNAQKMSTTPVPALQSVKVQPVQLSKVPDSEVLPANYGGAGKVAVANCTDKIDYVGGVTQYNVKVGGQSFYRVIGAMQVYPAYKGTVTSVEFNASKFINNVTVYVAIFAVDAWGQPVATSQSAPVQVLVTSAVNSLYTAIFPTPISVTSNNGFAIGLYTLNQDSVRAYTGPQITTWTNNYGYLYTAPNNTMYDFPTYTGQSYDLNMLLRPIVTTSISATMTSAKTSTGCAMPFVFSFTNTTTGTLPSYINHPIINPGGVTRSLDYGDGSPVHPNFSTPVTHSYTTIGNYIADYSRTYTGWTNNCVESATVQVDVDVPVPAFTYTVFGLTVNFTNTSSNLNSFIWNFGDLSTSTAIDPSHTFASSGTYVVELEGTAPCGTVRHSISVTVAGGVGVGENANLQDLISVFPNPATNVLKINNGGRKELEGTIDILNSIGASVKTVKKELHSGTVSIDISDLSKGMYFVKIKSKEGDIVKSFIKE